MKVKDLIEKLLKMPQEANVLVELRQSENDLDITKAEYYEKPNSVCLIADWRDFELDEDEVYWCEQELDEIAKEDAIEMMIDKAMGK